MWTSKSLASRFKHEFFRTTVKMRLTAVARLLLYPVSFYYALNPAVRKRYSYYLEHRFGSSGGLAGLVRTARAYKNFADILLDRMILGISGTLPVKQDQSTLDTLRGILAEGNGCMLVSAHFGSWQLGTLGLEELGRPIHLVQWIDEGDVDRHYFQNSQHFHDIHIINAKEGFPAVVEIRKALKENGIVCFMGDRLTPNDRDSIAVPFLGGTIRIPSAPYVLASAAGAPIMHTFSVRKDSVITGLPPVVTRLAPNIRKDRAALEEAARRFASRLEELTLQYPFHFFNFYDVWSSQNDQE
ncbi:MAG: lysophospholipid acyltransferase family protein [Mailhella sp.]|nr:lysophospholipid acyltransferase family protein [Mailhella sp.]